MRFEFAYMRLSFFPYSFGIETYTPVVLLKTMPDYSLKTQKNHTLWGDTYLYEYPPPPTGYFPVPVHCSN